MIKAYYKLVRDKIPTLIKKSGKNVISKKIKKGDFKHYLKIKLKEEIDEILKTESKKEIIERIADIDEVLDYVAKEYNITPNDIKKEKKEKSTKKGKYNQREFLVLTEE